MDTTDLLSTKIMALKKIASLHICRIWKKIEWLFRHKLFSKSVIENFVGDKNNTEPPF
jgi:hypothetical protein